MVVTADVVINSGIPDFTCQNAIASISIESISIDIFEPVSTFIRIFGCRVRQNYDTNIKLLYNFTFENRTVILSERVNNTLVADLFMEGSNSPNVSVCMSNYSNRDTCNTTAIPLTIDLGIVEISVQRNTSRLFPYGTLTRDSSFHGITDGIAEHYFPEEIPFFGGYYRSLYVRKDMLYHTIIKP